MGRRYQVRATDNLGSVEGLKRDRTWDVIDTTTQLIEYSALDTRAEARGHALRLNRAHQLTKELVNLKHAEEALDERSQTYFLTVEESNTTTRWRWDETEKDYVFCGSF